RSSVRNLLKPEISAPGVLVRSALRGTDTAYGFFSGTSMASPHVAGVVALLWSARPQLLRDIAATKAVLTSTANPNVTVSPPQTCGGTSSTTIPNNSFGWGRVDALAAFNSVVPSTSFFTVDPCRLADTRNPDGPSGGPALPANSSRSFPVTGLCGIPTTAKAVAINLAAFLPSDDGDLRIFPAGGAVPLASALNFRAGIVRANNAVATLGTGGQLSVQCDMPSGSTHFFFDVFGYFQ